MSRDYEPISTDGKRGPGLRVLLAIALVAFAGGIILTGWLATRYGLFEQDESAAITADESASSPPALAARSNARNAAGATEPSAEQALSLRVAELENRLSRINVQAEAASGNAARAEGLLIAFATRRSVEQGRPLGYLDQQLQLRFGEAEPEAVETIRKFAADPVVLEKLQSSLEELGDQLTTEGKGGVFDRISSEIAELFLIRKQGTPSTANVARLKRARRFAQAGNIRAAIGEVEKLPGAEQAKNWVADAQRYQKAQEALERLEVSAIFEPRSLRDSYGASVQQPSPLPPEKSAVEAMDDTGNEEQASAPQQNATPASGKAKQGENFFGF